MMNNKTYSVSELNKEVAHLLEASYPAVSLEGEISNLTKHSSGHWYFSLKDDKAQVSCAMFKMSNRQVKMSVESGMKVKVQAKVSLYAPRGNYQLIVNNMMPAGVGDLQQAFEDLKKKLHSEGLFAMSHKLPLPAFPKKIAVITSPTGAAIQDILDTCRRRFAAIPIDVYPCIVQGEHAAKDITKQLQNALAHNQADIIILARGGGSIEDLWGFNDETLARTIFDAHIPIITGVGHEIDTTIVDFVADYAAPTPTGAAEIATPEGRVVSEKILRLQNQLRREIGLNMRTLQQKNDILYHKLSSKNPSQRLHLMAQKAETLEKNLSALQQQHIKHTKAHVVALHQRLYRNIKATNFKSIRASVNQNHSEMAKIIQRRLQNNKSQIASATQLLSSLGPQQVLQRGYVYITDSDGNVIKKREKLETANTAKVHFIDGEIAISADKSSH